MTGEERVLLYGIDSPIGLTLVRELGQHGVEVYGIGSSKLAVGLYSRFLTKGYVFSGSLEHSLGFLRDIAQQERCRLLMTISENHISFFNDHRNELAELTCLFPDQTRMDLVLDKKKTYSVAREVGIDVPTTYIVQDLSELEALRSSLSYPLILKWSHPQEVFPQLHAQKIPLRKVEYCYNETELYSSLARYNKVGQLPLIQTFCPGYGLGQMVFMSEGQALLTFQHRRLHEWPPGGGVSSLCESVALTEHAPMMEKSVELLRRLHWEGPAMVEYRYDPKEKRTVLMEINGRFWGSLPLAYYAGAPFAWYTYSVLGKKVIPSHQPYTVGLRCVYMAPELKRLGTILFRSQEIHNKTVSFSRFNELWSFVSTILDPRVRHYLLSFTDPMPALADAYFIVQKLLRMVKAKIGSRFLAPTVHFIRMIKGRGAK